MNKVKISAIGALAYLMPVVASAQRLDTIAGQVQNILNLVVPIIMTLALIYFFYGLAKYILSAGDDEEKGKGRNIMIYGIIALFVMGSVWGLTQVIGNSFNIGAGNAPDSQQLIPR